MNIEIEREEDGRWMAEVPDLPGVMAYGQNKKEAVSKVKALALRVMADRLEQRKVDVGFQLRSTQPIRLISGKIS